MWMILQGNQERELSCSYPDLSLAGIAVNGERVPRSIFALLELHLTLDIYCVL